MAMKRTAWVVLFAALAGPLVAAGIPKPSATLTKFEVAAISLRDVTFLFELSVQNPYPLALSFGGMTLAFAVEGTQVFTASSQGGFSVPANGSKSNSSP
jgi:hypothetical protein